VQTLKACLKWCLSKFSFKRAFIPSSIYDVWLAEHQSPKRCSKKWRFTWSSNLVGHSPRVNGPQWKQIDALATTLGFESLAVAGKSSGSLVSLITLVPALVLLTGAHQAGSAVDFVAEQVFEVLRSFINTQSEGPGGIDTTDFLLGVFRIANYMGSSVAGMDCLFL
jgi:hypothetical protein